MKKSAMARIVEFDQLIRRQKYPNKRHVYRHYGVCDRTIVRDIEYLRDTLGAPLEFDRVRNGYFYSEQWELPTVVVASMRVEERVQAIIASMNSLTEEERKTVCNSFGFYHCTLSTLTIDHPSSPMTAA